ncbi:hypothetical protein [Kingella denitrificans]|uniref:hypothetical protein n=1 Tax=Kingella denitrificans TaxID=502 RepID=UPI002889E8C0|nr:hypothetical protein [Kingella denitrificans]
MLPNICRTHANSTVADTSPISIRQPRLFLFQIVEQLHKAVLHRNRHFPAPIYRAQLCNQSGGIAAQGGGKAAAVSVGRDGAKREDAAPHIAQIIEPPIGRTAETRAAECTVQHQFPAADGGKTAAGQAEPPAFRAFQAVEQKHTRHRFCRPIVHRRQKSADGKENQQCDKDQ